MSILLSACWVGFGGKRAHVDRHDPFRTALREFVEETDGYFVTHSPSSSPSSLGGLGGGGVMDSLRTQFASMPDLQFTYVPGGKYVVFLMRVPFDPGFEVRSFLLSVLFFLLNPSLYYTVGLLPSFTHQ